MGEVRAMKVFWRIMYTKFAIFFHFALTEFVGGDTLYVTTCVQWKQGGRSGMRNRVFTFLYVFVGILSLCLMSTIVNASPVGDSYGDFLSPKEDGEQVQLGEAFTVKYEANYHNGRYGNRTHHCNIRIKDPDGTIVLDDDYIYTMGSTVQTSFTPTKEGVYTIREQCYFQHPAGGKYVGDDKTITICVVKNLSSETETVNDSPADTEPTPADTSITEFTVGSCKYIVNKDQTTVTAPKSSTSTKISIPATVKINGKSVPVTSIAANAFKGCSKLKTVTIGKNVTSIGEKAFSGCKALTKVSIGAGVKTIGKNAFLNCAKLKTVSGGKGLTTIGASAFSGCKALTKITLYAKVKKIGAKAFYKCSKLKTITVKTSKLTSKTVGANAFKGIYAKATIKVPKAKLKAYMTLLKKKGVGKNVKIKK